MPRPVPTPARLPTRPRRVGAVLAVTGAVVVGVTGLAAGAYVVRRPLLMAAPSCFAGRWHGCYDTVNGVVLMTLVLLPGAALVAWGLAARRRARADVAPWRTAVADVGILFLTVPLVWLTLQPGSGAGTSPARVSLPLRDLATTGSLGIVGNLMIFAPLGLLAPVRWPALASLPRVLLLAAACSTLVELAQFAFRLDRVSSVDDVLVNTTGAVLAALASRHWWRPR